MIVRGNGGPLRVLDVRRFDDAEASGALDPWLETHEVSRVISVLPASSVICRTCTLPQAEESQLEPALRLQAESHLLGLAPSHRLTMAVLPGAPGENSRVGLVLAWPENSPGATPPTERPVTYTADVAAIAGLLAEHRPPEPVIWLDRASGGIAMALSHSNGTVFRATRESSEQDAEWRESVSRVLGETALNVGHSASFVESMVEQTRQRLAESEMTSDMLLIPDEVVNVASAKLEGVTADREWWHEYGIAAGAALAATGSISALTNIQQHPPREKPSRLLDFATRLTQPRTAAKAIAACVLILALGPLAFSGLRLQLLQWRFGDVEQKLQRIGEAEGMLAMYSYLDTNARSMTKLMSDVACNTPNGIEINSIRVNQSGVLNIDGRAIPQDDGKTAKELVSLMQQRMAETFIFDNIELDWGDPDNYKIYEFSLRADVTRPHHEFQYPVERDYGRYTVVDRRDGNEPLSLDELIAQGNNDGAASSASTGDGQRLADAGSGSRQSPDAAQTASEQRQSATRRSDNSGRDSTSRTPGARGNGAPDNATASTDRGGRTDRPDRRSGRRTGPSGGSGKSRSDVTERGQGGQTPDRLKVPDPISEEEVNQMSKTEVMDHLRKVATARGHHGDDEELQERLSREFSILRDRLKELRQ